MTWIMLRGLVRETRHYGAFLNKFGSCVDEPVVGIDLPGAGTEHRRACPSTIDEIVDDIRNRVPAQIVFPVDVFAVSLGGMIALNWAARFPSDIRSVVIVNSSAADHSKMWERLLPRNWPRIVWLAARGRALERELAILQMTSTLPEDGLRDLAERHAGYADERPISVGVLVAQLRAAARAPLPKSISARLLFLNSAQDALVSSSCSVRMARALGAPIVTHPTAGHDLPLDDAGWVIEQVRSFVSIAERAPP